MGKKSPVDHGDTLAGDEKKDEKHGENGTKGEKNDHHLE
jgi:hypothetical protein